MFFQNLARCGLAAWLVWPALSPVAAENIVFPEFDKYLKGENDHLLDNPAAVHPNIINFQSK